MRLELNLDNQEAEPAVLEYPDFLLKFGDRKLKQTDDSLI